MFCYLNSTCYGNSKLCFSDYIKALNACITWPCLWSFSYNFTYGTREIVNKNTYRFKTISNNFNIIWLLKDTKPFYVNNFSNYDFKCILFSLKCVSKVEINYYPQISLTSIISVFISISLSCYFLLNFLPAMWLAIGDSKWMSSELQRSVNHKMFFFAPFFYVGNGA